MLLNDNEMILGMRCPNDYNKEMIKELNQYIKKRKIAYYAKLVFITIYNKETEEPLESEHYCVIIKPTKKYNTEKDNFNIFQIMKPYLNKNSDFVDFSVIGYPSFMQLYPEESVIIYE